MWRILTARKQRAEREKRSNKTVECLHNAALDEQSPLGAPWLSLDPRQLCLRASVACLSRDKRDFVSRLL